MSKSLKGILILIIVIIFSILIFKRNDNNNYYNVIKLSQEVPVLNRTSMDFLDTVVIVGLEELNLIVNPKVVVIRPLDISKTSEVLRDRSGEEINLKAFVYGREGQYVVWIRNLGRKAAIGVISHELIHIKQLADSTLWSTSKNLYYKGNTYTAETIPSYLDRPWERDAEFQGRILGELLEDRLLRK